MTPTPMDCEEARRWLRFASQTLESLRADLEQGFYNWACFKAQQAAELALKAIVRVLGLPGHGHSLPSPWREAVEHCGDLEELRGCTVTLNQYYIPPRYPYAWPGDVSPEELYTREDAERARECAQRIYRAVEGCLVECL